MEYLNTKVYFENPPSNPKIKSIMTQLGYRADLTKLPADWQTKLNNGIKDGLFICHPQGAYGRFPLIEHNHFFIGLPEQIQLKSKSLAELLSKSVEVVFMAFTVGPEIVKKIAEEIAVGDPAMGVILDAVASEAADAGLDWMMDFLNRILVPEAKRLTKARFSPGFGDFALSNQKIIFDLLNLTASGLSLTEKYMLIPEKSVLAVAGIERMD